MRIIHNTRLDRITATGAPQQETKERTVRGYGMSIDFLDGYAADARIFEKTSAVLHPERAALTEGEAGNRRRFGFVEHYGDKPAPKSGVMRYVGDAFFADPRTAEFVWQAVIEKIENDAEGRR